MPASGPLSRKTRLAALDDTLRMVREVAADLREDLAATPPPAPAEAHRSSFFARVLGR